MKVVILAGGLGTRISEESHLKPKPMIEIGGKPILWHIMKIYSSFGFTEFVICLGYRGYIIKEYFANYFLHTSDITFDFKYGNQLTYHTHFTEPWKVTLVDTGMQTSTGGRVKRIQPYVDNKPFMLTYGDGVSNVNIDALVKYHEEHEKMVTVTAVQPSGRYGALNIGENNTVNEFNEKPKGDGAWVNAGFFVMNPEVFEYLPDDFTALENGPMEKMSAQSNLVAYKHTGFWQSMDTMRDKKLLDDLWDAQKAPWKLW